MLMATLAIANGFTIAIPDLGRNQDFPNLSEKRITKAVRSVLRDQYGEGHVKVSCAAAYVNSEWVGACEINGEPLRYRVGE